MCPHRSFEPGRFHTYKEQGGPVDSVQKMRELFGRGGGDYSSSFGPSTTLSLSDQIMSAFTAVTSLPRVSQAQIALLLFNGFLCATSINILAWNHYGKLDALSFAYGIELLIFSIVSIGYSLSAENDYAFYSLLVLQVEWLVVVTGATLVGVLTEEPLWVRLTLLLWNWMTFAAFLALQRWFRESWGWRTYQVAGTNPDRIVEYKRYQQLAATVFMDMYHMAFFITAEAILVQGRSWWQTMLMAFAGAATLFLARPLIVAVRLGYANWGYAVFVAHAVGFCGLAYLAIDSTVRDLEGMYQSSRMGANWGPTAQWHFVVAVEWLAVAARLLLLATILRMRDVLNAQSMLGFHPSTNFGYLITDREVQDARRPSNGAPLARSQVVIYEATARTAVRPPRPPKEVRATSTGTPMTDLSTEHVTPSIDMLPSIQAFS